MVRRMRKTRKGQWTGRKKRKKGERGTKYGRREMERKKGGERRNK